MLILGCSHVVWPGHLMQTPLHGHARRMRIGTKRCLISSNHSWNHVQTGGWYASGALFAWFSLHGLFDTDMCLRIRRVCVCCALIGRCDGASVLGPHQWHQGSE